jgi:tRNA A-37 threonylcarbamoyl transferase component Bud32
VTDCPSQAKLVRFERGSLEEPEGAALARHVGKCAACAASVAQLREGDQERKFFQTALGGTTLLSDRDAVAVDPKEVVPRSESMKRIAASKAASAASDPGEDATTWIIPDYERVALCGEGSYGSVWAVRDRVGVYRALKLVDLDRLEKAGITCYELNALENYCRKVSRHPYLITVYHVGVAGRWLYYTMELADDQDHPGGIADPFPESYRPLTLATIIKGGRLKLDIAVEIARRLLRGLSKLHDLNLLHRDVKPSNIVIVNRNPKLADIGILTGDQGPAKVIGTPKYMPPDRAIDKTADVYAMGVVLREMIQSVPAQGADEVAEATRWDMERLDAVISRACAPRSADRYQSAAAMLEELEASRFEGTLLFEKLAAPLHQPIARQHVAVQLAFAFIHRIPWIMGGIIVLYLLSRI